MEIFIAGLILVALMVFVSTRIKKTAANAFDREKIETEKYAFFKPEGYIIPVKKDSECALEVYSKEKGTGEAGKINQSQAFLRIYENANFADICRNADAKTSKIISGEKVRDEDLDYYLMRGETIENGIGSETFYKIIGTPSGEVYELQVSILNDYVETYSSKASAMLQSFAIKNGQLNKTENNQFIGTTI